MGGGAYLDVHLAVVAALQTIWEEEPTVELRVRCWHFYNFNFLFDPSCPMFTRLQRRQSFLREQVSGMPAWEYSHSEFHISFVW